MGESEWDYEMNSRTPKEFDLTFAEYDGTDCKFCGRERVMVGGATERRICEKCERYQDERTDNA